ncbi:MAG: hypothetical protein MJ120_05425 [Clostridia bacterium]|nr:hypothetical protein [Clostridia bacterium]
MIEVSGKEVFSWLNDCDNLRLKVQGTSMRPFLHNKTDSVILIKPEKIKKGDIIVFERNGYYIMHRVISIKNGFVDTLGDNLIMPETNIPVENVVAVVSSVIRNGKEIDSKSLVWNFYSKVYIHPAIRKIIVKMRERLHENQR